MTRIVIEGVESRSSLLAALSVVLETFNRDDAYVHEEHVFLPSDVEPTPNEVGRQGPAETPPPLPLMPCPRRGRHQRLTDCWMCWCDVMRGAALEPEVLSPQAWIGTRG